MKKADKGNLDTSLEGSNVGGDERRRFDQIEHYASSRPASLILGPRLPAESWVATPTWGDLVALARSQRELEGKVERLRAALAEMVDLCEKGFFEEVGSPDFTGPALEAACAALERKS